MSKQIFKPHSNGIQVCSLGSGSKGNGTLIAFGDTLLLVDCGFSAKEATRRLALKGISPEQITAVLVTHEHADHIGGVATFSNKYKVPVWINRGTSFHKKCEKLKLKNIFNSHQNFKLGAFEIEPVAVPHDAREATQFIFTTHNFTLGLLTDVGHITPYILERYATCDLLLLEFNYEHELLMNGSYPYSLKRRVAGPFGHLSNEQASDMLRDMDTTKLKQLVAMHCSAENNSQTIVDGVLKKLSDKWDFEYFIAEQAEGFDWMTTKESLKPVVKVIEELLVDEEELECEMA